jgi:protease-4
MSNNFALVSALIRGDWAIEEQFALNSLELVERILSGSFIAPHADITPPEVTAARSGGSGSGRQGTGGQVMIISVSGVLMKADGDCGEMGMATMGNYVKEANRNPDIAGVVLAIDSPGGTVDGTEAFSRIIKMSAKPVIAYIDGMAASAALWIATSAREIIASSENDQVGSVGAMLRMMDRQPALERQGVRFHTILSDQTPDKNRHTLEIMNGQYDNFKKDHLNPLAQNFIDSIKANREGISESFLTGKMFFVKDALGAFVDRVGSLEDAIARVQELSVQTTQHQNQIIAMEQFERINAALGVESLESVDGSISLNEEQLTILEAALAVEPEADVAAVQEELNSVQASLTETQTSLETAQTDLTAAQARISELEAQVTELEKEPGDVPARLVKSTDGAPVTGTNGLTKEDIDLFNLIRS